MCPSRRSTPRALTGVGLGLRFAFLDEVRRGRTPASIAFFEVAPENYARRGGEVAHAFEEIAARHPIVSHGLMMSIGGTDPLDRDYLRELRGFIERFGLVGHSDHLCWSSEAGRVLHDLLPLPWTEATVRRVVERVRAVEDALGVPFALENIAYYTPVRPVMTELEFLQAVLDRSGCRLLLDVNNVFVNATNLGYDPYAFLSALPLDRVDQLHVAGGERMPDLDGLVIDTHGAGVPEPVAALMAWVIERVGPVPVVYERDHNIPSLEELGREVAALQGRYDDAVRRYEVRPAYDEARPEIVRASSYDDPGALGSMHSSEVGPERDPDAALLSVLAEGLLGREGPSSTEAWTARLRGCESEAAGSTSSQAVGDRRWQIYRTLVRRGLARVLEDFLPRSVARLGDPGFRTAFDAWLAERGPCSRYLRELPADFVGHHVLAWRQGPSGGVPRDLGDLAAYELLEAEVAMAPDGALLEIEEGAAFGLDRRLSFSASTRLAVYASPVWCDVDSTDGDEVLPKEALNGASHGPGEDVVRMLLYRDRDDAVRRLELSAFGYELVVALRERGVTVREAVVGVVAALGTTLDAETLARTAALLSDLAERGVWLGMAR